MYCNTYYRKTKNDSNTYLKVFTPPSKDRVETQMYILSIDISPRLRCFCVSWPETTAILVVTDVIAANLRYPLASAIFQYCSFLPRPYLFLQLDCCPFLLHCFYDHAARVSFDSQNTFQRSVPSDGAMLFFSVMMSCRYILRPGSVAAIRDYHQNALSFLFVFHRNFNSTLSTLSKLSENK